MKKLILCMSVAFTTAFSYNVNAKEDDNNAKKVASAAASTNKAQTIDEYITSVYNAIDFGGKKLAYDVFKKAYTGFLNLRSAGQVSKNILSIADFSQPSTAHRLWVIDLVSKKLLINDYVAHGQGSGDLYATKFSNQAQSHQSSLGFYITDGTYVGKHGTSLRLRGVDQGYNHSAMSRAVVIHGANYVSNDAVAGMGRLGRSWGCPAVSNSLAPKFISAIKDGSVLFVYAPQKDYLSSSTWLNRACQVPNGGTL
ncbi:murein L,D-transpeptidase catalytic domain family protein [Polluticoccus soli]|uniref:murein L,D-transpeptidase catalytic domain family protein n=1 Tax=Polluticoccus soli TaxID=3034150 RepID=UPI0023E2FDD0|nr:murein L,D-transpeptidase catalytic domain family protein [Flavipsychrobacter sp. JY13-12]